MGSAIGAIAGASIAANSSSYYDSGYYVAPATVYYDSNPAYYPAAPVYYPAARVYYAPRADYDHNYAGSYADHRRPYESARRDWHGDDGHHRR